MGQLAGKRQAIMIMSEAPKFLINLLADINNKAYGIFMNLPMSSGQSHFQNGSHNEV